MGLNWRSSYQRRGFVTFTKDEPFTFESLEVEIAGARRLCLSLGKSTTREEAAARLGDVAVVHHAKFHDHRMQGVHDGAPLVRPQDGEPVGTVVELGEGEF